MAQPLRVPSRQKAEAALTMLLATTALGLSAGVPSQSRGLLGTATWPSVTSTHTKQKGSTS